MAPRKPKFVDDEAYTSPPASKRKATAYKQKQRSPDYSSEADSPEVDDLDRATQVSSQRSDESAPYYTAETILAENKSEYKIKWEGIDPETGKIYKPTW